MNLYLFITPSGDKHIIPADHFEVACDDAGVQYDEDRDEYDLYGWEVYQIPLVTIRS